MTPMQSEQNTAISPVVYYLAEGKPWELPKLIDGGHSTPEAAANAAVIMRRIFPETRNSHYVVVAVHPLPKEPSS